MFKIAEKKKINLKKWKKSLDRLSSNENVFGHFYLLYSYENT